MGNMVENCHFQPGAGATGHHSRQMRVQSSLAPLPGFVRFYSKTQPFPPYSVCQNRAKGCLVCCCSKQAFQ